MSVLREGAYNAEPGCFQPAGLTGAEVIARRQAGQGNISTFQSSRTYANIIRHNLLNPFNVILFLVGVLLIALGRLNDAILSVALVLFNAVLGTVQEIRAKRTLDEIALLTRPKVTVVRESVELELDPAELVQGDLLFLQPGDQVVVDGPVVAGNGLEVDESLLTGESDAVRKAAGDSLYSGSFCISGSGYYTAERVGQDSYANQLTSTARQFQVVRTPLQREINFVLRLLTVVAVFFVSILVVGAFMNDVPPVRFAQIAAIVMGIISAGLMFTIILAYAIAAVRLVNKGALVQQAHAVESLSHVDTLCMDKTGTLTANRFHLHDIYPLDDGDKEVKAWLGDFAASVPSGNRTIEAIRAVLPGRHYPLVGEVPFASVRRWSALSFHQPGAGLCGTFVLGAPEQLLPYLNSSPTFLTQVEEWAAAGLRVLLFAYNPDVTGWTKVNGEPQPPRLCPLALISFQDELRPHVQQTISGFEAAGIELKIISGDHPETVAALARQAGLPVGLTAVSGALVDKAGDPELSELVSNTTVFGRINPEQKQRLVETFRRKGRYVAMIGDGVNDVLSLKTADVGVAMQSGSAAARGVADMILLNDSFEALVPAFQEGQRIVSGMGNILRIYLSRLLSIALLINVLALLRLGFPTLPAQEAFTTILTVGIPTIFLTYWARPERPAKRLLMDVVPFVGTTIILISIFGMLVYVVVFTYFMNIDHMNSLIPDLSFWLEDFVGFALADPEAFQEEAAGLMAQSALTLFRALVGILIILFVSPPIKLFAADRPLSSDRRPAYMALILLLLGITFLIVPALRTFFGLQALTLLSPYLYGVIFLAVLLWLAGMSLVLRRKEFYQI